jgi:hypothetical protein
MAMRAYLLIEERFFEYYKNFLFCHGGSQHTEAQSRQ